MATTEPLPTPEDELIYSQTTGIGTITFNRPQARNALTFNMYERLKRICADAPEDGSLKAIIVTGAGERAFAAGTDIAQFRDFKTAEDGHDYETKMEAVFEAVERCPVPTIAAIAGACTGGGAGIAVACDIRLASADLKFGFPIARTLGNCLSARNLQRLAVLIGPGRVKELIFTSRLAGAQEALAAGLVSEVLPDHAALVARAAEVADTLAEQAPLTLRATKEALRRLKDAAPVDDRDLIALCYTSEDFREGMEAFLAKRKPVWKGR